MIRRLHERLGISTPTAPIPPSLGIQRISMNTRKIEYVSELIRRLLPKEPDVQPTDLSRYAKIISRFDEGTLLLDPTESRAYAETLARLLHDFGKAEDISPATIEQALQTAIFFAIDITKKRQERPLEERIRTAKTELLNALRQSTKSYECYVPVGGIEAKGLPYRFGRVNFLVFNQRALRKFIQAVQEQEVSDNEKKFRTSILERLQLASIWKSPCARTQVRARDFAGALVLARQRIRVAIDSLNFFSDMIPYNTGWLYFPEEAAPTSLASPILTEDHSFSVLYQRTGPVMEFSFEKLRGTRPIQPFLRKVDRLLRHAPLKDVDEVLISAVQWAGRASIEGRREEAFLLSAIALESLILPERESRELSYRLRIRTAHLLGDTVEARSGISKEVSDLYAIRSKIVHSGHYQIIDPERQQIREILRRVILKILGSRSVAKLGSREELGRWFERKVLS
jgi:hypothetical protein